MGDENHQVLGAQIKDPWGKSAQGTYAFVKWPIIGVSKGPLSKHEDEQKAYMKTELGE